MSDSALRVLISVSDKQGVVAFASQLHALGAEILSTGGTAKLLQDNDIPVVEVSDYTGFPEMMAGRVKTLHPKIHGGLLAREGTDDAVASEHGIGYIDLLVANLYPFSQVIAKPDCTLEQAIENIDIGGPAMLRSAAKNHDRVAVLVDSTDYASIVQELQQNNGRISLKTRRQLAVKAFSHTAAYDSMIARYLGANMMDEPNAFGEYFLAGWRKISDLRYGENPHQQAALYSDGTNSSGVVNAKQLAGKALSFNNIADADTAFECVRQFDQSACVIVKHANPCGVAVGDDILACYQKAYATDPESAFGGIIAFNRMLDATTAHTILEQQFVEVIVATEIDPDVLPLFEKKPNVRLLVTGLAAEPASGVDIKRVAGGVLVQDLDQTSYQELEVVTARKPDDQQMQDLLFAWQVASYVKSNAIVYAKDNTTLGVGAGQMSRINSVRIGEIKAEHAGLSLQGAVMASDAFFPFRDILDYISGIGVKAVIQPGGSIRDKEVIAAADALGIAMVFTGARHFRH